MQINAYIRSFNFVISIVSYCIYEFLIYQKFN
nr:MAG TPA: hypothetical protein [Caudoviricetes sp.]